MGNAMANDFPMDPDDLLQPANTSGPPISGIFGDFNAERDLDLGPGIQDEGFGFDPGSGPDEPVETAQTIRDAWTEPILQEEVSRCLQTASYDTGVDRLQLKQPREQGLMTMIFGTNPTLPKISPPCFVPKPPETFEYENVDGADRKADAASSAAVSMLSKIARKTEDIDYLAQRTAMRTLAINKFASLVMRKPEAFALGRSILSDDGVHSFEDHLKENLLLVFGLKSPATLNKRANALMLYAKSICDSDLEPFPIVENMVAHYFFQLRRSGTFTSRASLLREALRFCHYTLGLDGALEGCDSGRVKGCAELMLSGKQMWSPADPFTVEEVMMFHRMLYDLCTPRLWTD